MQFNDALHEFVDALPREQLPELKAALEGRLCREALALAKAATAAAPESSRLLSTTEAAAELGCSPDEIRDRVRRGTLAVVRDRAGARLHFAPADLAAYKAAHRTPVARELDRRYSIKYDTPRRPDTPPPARPHATRARNGARRDADDRGAVGAGRAHGHAARRGRPYTPGKAAWSEPPEEER